MVTSATFSFIGRLNNLLPIAIQNRETSQVFASHQSVKHLIESLGIPHVEVGLISANGQLVRWDYRPADGDRIVVAPSLDVPEVPRFILDNHLGRLAAYLRMLGFDSLYENSYTDEQMAALVVQDPRILLTRDRRLLMRKVIQDGYCLRSLVPQVQLQEVVSRYKLLSHLLPFHRCLRCNALLKPAQKQDIIDRLEPKTKLYYNEFSICMACGQVYWKGSHYDHMQALVAKITLD